MKIDTVRLTYWIFAALVIGITASSVAPMTPVQTASMNRLYQQIETQAHSQTTFQNFWGIFTNNAIPNSFAAVPVIGPYLFGKVLYTTGLVIESFAPSTGWPTFLVAPLGVMAPHGILEFFAYALALLFGLEAILVARARDLELAKRLPLLLAASFGVLLLAAVFEASEIAAEQLYPGLSVLAWVPFYLIVWKGYERFKESVLEPFDAVLPSARKRLHHDYAYYYDEGL